MHRGNDCEHLGEFLVRLDEFGNALVYLLNFLIEFRDDVSTALRDHRLDR